MALREEHVEELKKDWLSGNLVVDNLSDEGKEFAYEYGVIDEYGNITPPDENIGKLGWELRSGRRSPDDLSEEERETAYTYGFINDDSSKPREYEVKEGFTVGASDPTGFAPQIGAGFTATAPNVMEFLADPINLHGNRPDPSELFDPESYRQSLSRSRRQLKANRAQNPVSHSFGTLSTAIPTMMTGGGLALNALSKGPKVAQTTARVLTGQGKTLFERLRNFFIGLGVAGGTQAGLYSLGQGEGTEFTNPDLSEVASDAGQGAALAMGTGGIVKGVGSLPGAKVLKRLLGDSNKATEGTARKFRDDVEGSLALEGEVIPQAEIPGRVDERIMAMQRTLDEAQANPVHPDVPVVPGFLRGESIGGTIPQLLNKALGSEQVTTSRLGRHFKSPPIRAFGEMAAIGQRRSEILDRLFGKTKPQDQITIADARPGGGTYPLTDHSDILGRQVRNARVVANNQARLDIDRAEKVLYGRSRYSKSQENKLWDEVPKDVDLDVPSTYEAFKALDDSTIDSILFGTSDAVRGGRALLTSATSASARIKSGDLIKIRQRLGELRESADGEKKVFYSELINSIDEDIKLNPAIAEPFNTARKYSHKSFNLYENVGRLEDTGKILEDINNHPSNKAHFEAYMGGQGLDVSGKGVKITTAVKSRVDELAEIEDITAPIKHKEKTDKIVREVLDSEDFGSYASIGKVFDRIDKNFKQKLKGQGRSANKEAELTQAHDAIMSKLDEIKATKPDGTEVGFNELLARSVIDELGIETAADDFARMIDPRTNQDVAGFIAELMPENKANIEAASKFARSYSDMIENMRESGFLAPDAVRSALGSFDNIIARLAGARAGSALNQMTGSGAGNIQTPQIVSTFFANLADVGKVTYSGYLRSALLEPEIFTNLLKESLAQGGEEAIHRSMAYALLVAATAGTPTRTEEAFKE